jgi:hypothetical protein
MRRLSSDDFIQELYWHHQWREAVAMLKKGDSSIDILLLEENAALCQTFHVIYAAQYWASVKVPHVHD